MTTRICSIKGCSSVVLARGWCKRHYNRWSRHGDPVTCLKALSSRGLPMKWLRDHINHTGKRCLIWPFATLPDGRGHMNRNGRTVKPSRLMCEMVNGPAPTPKHEAAHSCGNGHKACVYPEHVRWATKRENDEDKIKHGTLLKGENHPRSKLTEQRVRGIRKLANSVHPVSLAKRFGVARSCIDKIVNRTRWGHVA